MWLSRMYEKEVEELRPEQDWPRGQVKRALQTVVRAGCYLEQYGNPVECFDWK